jgi:hypothetical protein
LQLGSTDWRLIGIESIVNYPNIPSKDGNFSVSIFYVDVILLNGDSEMS